MSFKIVVSDEAEMQIFEAYTYYSEISESLANRFNKQLVATIDYLSVNPDYFQNRYRQVRIVLTKNFPYSVHYILKYKTVFVMKILHQKQFYN